MRFTPRSPRILLVRVPLRPRHASALLAAAGFVWLGAGCISGSVQRCSSGSELLRRSELFFGLAQTDGAVIDEQAFAKFVDAVVTPQLRAGFALIETDGQYLATDGHIVREHGRLLVVIHRGDAATERALELVRARYRREFAQESVLRVDTASCASF